MAYGKYRGRRVYRRKLGGVVRPFGRPLYPVPFKRKRPVPTTGTGAPVRMGRRVRPRYARSYTQTMTKTKTQFGKATKVGENSSISSNRIGKRRLNYVSSKMLAPRTVTEITGNSTNCTAGRQNHFSIPIMTRTALASIKSVLGGGDNNIRFALKTGRMRVSFKNQSNINARCVIYDIVAKNRVCPSALFDSPRELWEKGLTDYGVADTMYNPGLTPFKSPEFRKHFYVHKATYVNLEPGQQHEHSVWYQWNLQMDSTEFDNYASDTVPKCTRYVMVVFYGTLYHESTEVTEVTTAPITLDYSYTREYSFAGMLYNVPTMGVTNSLSTAIADGDFMGESGDGDTNVVAA